MTDSSTHDYDVLIAGGGPGGSSVATRLAEMGWRVLVLEKEQFPRFHIGESMLPMIVPLLKQLGVAEKIDAISIKKPGADFNCPRSTPSQHKFWFDNAMDKSQPYAYEVTRSEFDKVLLDNAAEKGANVRQGVRVQDVDFAADGSCQASIRTESGDNESVTAAYFIDATGRDTLLAKKHELKRKNPRHASAAIYGHFRNVVRREGYEEGNISVYWFDHGWIWMIPLKDGTMSVGAVCRPDYLKQRSSSPEEFLWETIGLSPGATERMRDAELINEVRATGNYSYKCTRMHGHGSNQHWLMVGDAYAFIDPIFSSGVLMAVTNGLQAADIVDAQLKGETAKVNQLLKRYEKRVARGIRVFSWFIERFNAPGLRRLFLEPGNPMRIEEAVTSVLAGDVYDDDKGIGWRLFLFKCLFYIFNLTELPNTLQEWKLRRGSKQIKFTGGTTPQDAT